VVAAIPSLHAAYTVLVAWGLWRSCGRIGRAALVAYPLAMGFVLVLTGEHYVIDVLLGWAYVAVVVVVWDRIEARRPRTRSPAPAPAG
jgi:membrane-associated phospholipid phosphatase